MSDKEFLKHPLVAAVISLIVDAESGHHRAEVAHDAKDEANRRWFDVSQQRDELQRQLGYVAATLERVRARRNERTALLVQAQVELATLQRQVQAVRELHQEYEGRCQHCCEFCDCLDKEPCTHGNLPWPCPTSQALDETADVPVDSEIGKALCADGIHEADVACCPERAAQLNETGDGK